MPTTYKVLGQVNPSATTATTLYTVPSATQTVISTITVANLAGSAATYRISMRPAGAAQTNAMYIAFDVTVGVLIRARQKRLQLNSSLGRLSLFHSHGYI